MSWQDTLHETASDLIEKYDLVKQSEESCQKLLLGQIKILEDMVSLLKQENAQLELEIVELKRENGLLKAKAHYDIIKIN